MIVSSLLLFGHLALALVAWFVALVIAPAAKLAFDTRAGGNVQGRGVSVFPGWPTLLVAFFVPLLFTGPKSIVALGIASFHVMLLLFGATHAAWYRLRAR